MLYTWRSEELHGLKKKLKLEKNNEERVFCLLSLLCLSKSHGLFPSLLTAFKSAPFSINNLAIFSRPKCTRIQYVSIALSEKIILHSKAYCILRPHATVLIHRRLLHWHPHRFRSKVLQHLYRLLKQNKCFYLQHSICEVIIIYQQTWSYATMSVHICS